MKIRKNQKFVKVSEKVIKCIACGKELFKEFRYDHLVQCPVYKILHTHKELIRISKLYQNVKNNII